MRWFLVASGLGLVIRKIKLLLKAWNFQPYSSSNRRKRRVWGWVNCWLWLGDDTSIKIPELWGSEFLNTQRYRKDGVHKESIHALHPSHHTLLCLSLPSSYICIHCNSFYNNAINANRVFPWILWVSQVGYRFWERLYGNPDLGMDCQLRLVLVIWTGRNFRGSGP
jgi:hypothetical protein